MTLNRRDDRADSEFFYPRTDAGPFLERGILTIGFTTGIHPRYHLPADEARYLDPTKMEAVARTVFASVWALANTPTARVSSDRFPRPCRATLRTSETVGFLHADYSEQMRARGDEMLRKSMLTLVIAAVLATPAITQPPATPVDTSRHLFLLVGQSNMAGRGKVEPQDTVPIPRVLMLDKQRTWVPAVDPMHFDKPIAGVGLGRTCHTHRRSLSRRDHRPDSSSGWWLAHRRMAAWRVLRADEEPSLGRCARSLARRRDIRNAEGDPLAPGRVRRDARPGTGL